MKAYASAFLFLQWRIGFIRRRLRFSALGFAQRGFLVSLSLFLLAPSTCCPRSLGLISSVIWLRCHCILICCLRTCRRYISTSRCHRSAIRAGQIPNDGANRGRTATRQEPHKLLCGDHVGTYVIPFLPIREAAKIKQRSSYCTAESSGRLNRLTDRHRGPSGKRG